jgi:hypothetical protein
VGNCDKLYIVRAANTEYYAWNKEQRIGVYFCHWWIPKYFACIEVFTGDKPWETGVGIEHFHLTDYSGRLHTRLRETGMFLTTCCVVRVKGFTLEVGGLPTLKTEECGQWY